jgi:hypothetical protein
MSFIPVGGQESDRDADQQDDQQERQFVMLDVRQEDLQDPTEEISPRGDDGRPEGRAFALSQKEIEPVNISIIPWGRAVRRRPPSLRRMPF